MNKKWIIKSQEDSDLVEQMSKKLNVSKPISDILISRNIIDWTMAKAFFRPDLNDLHDPFLMKDMKKATDRICKAIEEKEKICFYGDYDVDGVTSVAMCYIFFSNLYKNITYYIPDRHTEGYGLSQKGIDRVFEDNVKLIITLDCGINALDKIRYGNEKGIDFIVCDHHQVEKTLPSAHAILNPKRQDCTYPFDGLSGCGVGFKLLAAFSKRQNISQEKVFALLDLVALSIACDIVPVDNENRILLKYGLDLINKKQRLGIRYLISVVRSRNTLSTSDLVFKLGPRINASGRIGKATDSVNLLIANSHFQAKEYARKIDETNKLRRKLDASTTQEALAMIAKKKIKYPRTNVLFHPKWNKGVIGIVASRCIERYYCPTVILTKSGENAIGSARSIENFDIYEAIKKCENLLIQFGGHSAAAGLSMELKNISAFQKYFEKVVAEQILNSEPMPKLYIDAVVELNVISSNFYSVIAQMAPFGPCNIKPRFLTRRVYSHSVNIIKNKYLTFKVSQENTSITLNAMGFELSKSHCDLLISNKLIDICYTIEKNNLPRQTSLCLLIRDIKPAFV